MSVDPAEVARIRRLADHVPDSGEFAQLETLDALVACVVAIARAEGMDALNSVELLLTALNPARASLRASARVLGRLGYVDVATLMRELAHRAPRAKPRKPRAARTRRPS